MGAEVMGWLELEIDAAYDRVRMSRMENTLFARPDSCKVDSGQVRRIAAAVLEGSPVADWFATS